jgi:hypothetical protein
MIYKNGRREKSMKSGLRAEIASGYGNLKPKGEVVKMKRNGLTVTPEELQIKAKELESETQNIHQEFEIPIINPFGEADGWRFEEPAC